MAVRLATEEEKRKIADSIEVEIESAPESKDPIDVVLSQIQSYHDNMVQQISNVEQMIDVNDKIIKAVSALYDTCENEQKKNIYKEELGTRQDVLFNLRKSLIIMKERISLTNKVKGLIEKDLDMIKMLDFYFGNSLGIFDEKDMNTLLESKLNS